MPRPAAPPWSSVQTCPGIGAFTVAVEGLVNACAAARPKAARRVLRERDRMIERRRVEIG